MSCRKWTWLAVRMTVATIFLTTSPAFAKFKAVTSFTIIADIARNVAGDAATVVSITKPGAEIHNYQPTPQDIVRAQDADLILRNGLNLELWFEKFLANLNDVPDAVLTENVIPLGITKGPYTGKPNPHAWMSPANAMIYTDNIAKAFATHDPDNADIYFANAEDYKTRIAETIAPLRAAISSIPEQQRWLVSSEGAFSYLAREFGLKELYLWPINSDRQGTPAQVRYVIDQVRANNIKAIFSESTISPAAAQQVARETDAEYGGVLYVDSLSDANGTVPNYLGLMQVTLQTIVKGLTQ